MPEFWNLVRDYDYDEPVQQVSQPVRFITALNSGDPDKVAALYEDNAIHIRPEHAMQGKEAIREWIASLMDQFKDGQFSLLGGSSYDNIYSFQWEASNAAGETLQGRDTQGIQDDKIRYHYSFIKKVQSAS
jgi:hypothetical protein